jgi:hypothetical protein
MIITQRAVNTRIRAVFLCNSQSIRSRERLSPRERAPRRCHGGATDGPCSTPQDKLGGGRPGTGDLSQPRTNPRFSLGRSPRPQICFPPLTCGDTLLPARLRGPRRGNSPAPQ